MKNLSTEQMININGGNSDKKKERSTFGGIVDSIGGAIIGFGGVVSSWFS